MCGSGNEIKQCLKKKHDKQQRLAGKRPNGSTSTGSETVRKHRKKETPKREGVSEASGKEQRRRTVQRISSSEDSDSDDERSGASATTIEYIELSSDDMDEG